MKSRIRFLLFALVFAAVAQAQQNAFDHKIDLEVIDRTLANAKPGDPWVKFGDVGIKYADLKVYRDRLAGKSIGPEPSVVTPPGTTFKWPGGNISYRFDPTQVGNGTITAAKMQQVRDSVAEWAAFANLTFTEFSGAPPANYITVQQDPTLGGGFSSSVGMAGGEQFVKIGPNAWNRGTICHEVGHALGLFHEQQRPDRGTYVIINFGNMAPADQPNFTIVATGQTFGTSYDFYSVMHYKRNDLSNNGGDTISMQPAYAQYLNLIGQVQDRTLSKSDRAGMAAIYGNPGSLPSPIVSNTKDSGPGSLRTAIYYAFDRSTDPSPVPTTVLFHIPFSDPNYDTGTGIFTIKPTYTMTAPGNGTTIDGTSQTAFNGNTNANGPEITLDGSNFGVTLFSPGLILRAANCTIKGLTIKNFSERGIDIRQGSDPNGSAATGNVIGGTTAAERNIISGNTAYGIGIRDATTTNNIVQGNYIGTDQTGAGAQPNGSAGIVIYLSAHGNTIGGTTSNARNVISGNTIQGIFIGDAGSNNNVIQGNYIGVNATGAATVPNLAGIDIQNGPQSNTIGGIVPGAGNVISGNQFDGIDIDGAGTNANLVAGNIIGLNASGTAKIQNGGVGVQLHTGAQSNLVGGAVSGARNVISGNHFQGVTINGAGTNQNQVQGNYIGVDPAGTSSTVGNGSAGISISAAAQSNTVGGTAPGAGNVISGNTFQGVTIDGSGTTQNQVQGNLIGLNSNGDTAIPNNAGISIYNGAQSNTVGGAVFGSRNVISGNTFQAVTLDGASTTLNVIAGNYVGLDKTGITQIPNTSTSIAISNAAHDNTVGGTAAGSRNFICGSTFYGISIVGAGTDKNLVLGNTIGLNTAGAARANSFQGVAIFNGAKSNVVGGSAVGASNLISGNGFDGIALFDATTKQNTFSGNSTAANGGKGIRLNDNSNGDTGISQPFPSLISATLSTATNPNGTDIAGTMNSTTPPYRLEFFASPAGDPSGFGEGQFLVGSIDVNTPGSNVPFTAALPAVVPAGYVIAATATVAAPSPAPTGNTSEFSANQTVIATTDTDSDGMPNNWENAHTLNPNLNDANADSDGDGMTNIQEFRAGTDPRNPASRIAISSIDQNAGNPRISFTGRAGKTYRLEYRDDLASGSWNTLVDQILGTGALIQVVDPSSAGLGKRFYRVSLEP